MLWLESGHGLMLTLHLQEIPAYKTVAQPLHQETRLQGPFRTPALPLNESEPAFSQHRSTSSAGAHLAARSDIPLLFSFTTLPKGASCHYLSAQENLNDGATTRPPVLSPAWMNQRTRSCPNHHLTTEWPFHTDADVNNPAQNFVGRHLLE